MKSPLHHSSLTRRRLLAGVGLVLATTLAACGSDSSGSSGGKGATSSETRTVVDATGGEVTVPAAPTKVVTLHYAGTQAVLDLDGDLAGTGVFEEGVVPEDYVSELEKVPVVTTADGPKVEEIAGLGPDLILAPNTLKEDVLSQLRQIAPVFQFTLRGGQRAQWQTRVEEVARALGREKQFATLRDDFAAEQAAVAKKYSGVARNVRVGTVSSYEENTAYLWGSKNMIGTILLPLGVTWSQDLEAAVAGQKEPEVTLSLEKLPQSLGDATLIFYDTDLRGKSSAFTETLKKSPLYAELPAVKSGNTFGIGKFTIAGFSDARYSLAKADEALAKVTR